MDASIILGGQQLDLIGAMDRGRAAAENKINLDRQNAMNALLRNQGAGIMAGDPTALNALAQYDPQTALGIKSTVQQNAWAEEDRAAAKAEGKRMAEEALKANADKLTAEQLAAEREAITKGLSGAAFFYQNGDQAGYNNFLTQHGMNPAEFPFEQFPAHAAMFDGALEAMQAFAPPKPPEPQSAEAKLRADFSAGLIDQGMFEAGLARLAPKTTSLSVDPATGAVTFTDGAAGGAGGGGSGDALRASMMDAESVLGLIQDIANDPALPGVTGSLEGGGGNNVDDFSMTRRAYYGDKGLAVIQKIAQLQGNAWLGARALLKGGGAITDYESRKAEGAMARLSRAQGDKEFQAALKDLRDAITEGMAKLNGAPGSGSPPSATGFDQAEIDQLMNGP